MYIMVRHRITRPYGMLVVHLSIPYINKSNSTTMHDKMCSKVRHQI